jgi:DNA repair protein RecO (recombination protein O)
LSELTDLNDPHPKLFDAAVITLRHLGDPVLLSRRLLRFELALLRELGHMPALDACAHCGAAVTMTARRDTNADVDRTREAVAFGLATGGVLCPACRPGQPHVASVSEQTLGAIRALAAPGPSWRQLDPDPAALGPVRTTLGHVISHLLGRRPRLLPYLGV